MATFRCGSCVSHTWLHKNAARSYLKSAVCLVLLNKIFIKFYLIQLTQAAFLCKIHAGEHITGFFNFIPYQ